MWSKERYAKAARVSTTREWTVEPCDVHGDVIDTLHVEPNREIRAHRVAVSELKEPGVHYVDVCVVTRTGSEAEGEMERVYDYKTRYYVDGRVFKLTTDRQGLSPILVVDIDE